jgi:hypothetical protein
MKNLAGVKECNSVLAEELLSAGAELVEVEKTRSEVPYTYIGKVGDWTLTRAWYYWMANTEGKGLPLAVAEVMHNKPYPEALCEGHKMVYGDQIRVAGHCGCLPPNEWAFPDYAELLPQLNEKGITDRCYGNLAKLLDEGVLTGDRFVKNYHIDTQEGLNEFVRVIKSLNP